jgi:hypothetical protein
MYNYPKFFKFCLLIISIIVQLQIQVLKVTSMSFNTGNIFQHTANSS